jgi:AcrR family transcriptional regulator
MTSEDPPASAPRRRRNAAATRAAILESALVAFTRLGYDGAGVREIAEAAGGTAMLVNRYFGSKEELFAEVVDVSFAPRTVVVTADRSQFGRDVAANLVARTAPDAEDLDPFLLMLRSAANPRAAEILRAGVERHVARDLADLLPGAEPGERAGVALSLIAGMWLMRKVLGTTALREADTERLADYLETIFAGLVNPTTQPSADSPAG